MRCISYVAYAVMAWPDGGIENMRNVYVHMLENCNWHRATRVRSHTVNFTHKFLLMYELCFLHDGQLFGDVLGFAASIRVMHRQWQLCARSRTRDHRQSSTVTMLTTCKQNLDDVQWIRSYFNQWNITIEMKSIWCIQK